MLNAKLSRFAEQLQRKKCCRWRQDLCLPIPHSLVQSFLNKTFPPSLCTSHLSEFAPSYPLHDPFLQLALRQWSIFFIALGLHLLAVVVVSEMVDAKIDTSQPAYICRMLGNASTTVEKLPAAGIRRADRSQNFGLREWVTMVRPVARVLGLGEYMLGGQGFCFYFMFKIFFLGIIKFGGAQNNLGSTAPECPPWLCAWPWHFYHWHSTDFSNTIYR